MNAALELIESASARWAYLTESRLLTTVLPTGTIGAYVLFGPQGPLYVGRSDHCLFTRLQGHPLREVTTHVAFEPCRSPMQAFWWESAWFHTLSSERTLLNRIHPARPAGHSSDCLYCSPGDVAAWSHALTAVISRGAAQVPDHIQDRRKNSEV